MSAGGGNSLKAILYAFFANLGIAAAKFAAAIFTGSSSMLAEAIHSTADSGNQLLLLLGLNYAKKPPTEEHPLGHGKATFFWSFIVAIVLFSLGGVFSLYEGYHKLGHEGPVESVWVALLVLGMAIVLESLSLRGALREINPLRAERSLRRWLKESRNAELVVVFGEDVGALIGLVVAFVFLCIAAVTGDSAYDAYGSMAIGAILIVIAVWLGNRIHALLLGRSADPGLQAAIHELIAADDNIVDLFNVITMQMGPDVMLAAKIRMRSELRIGDACESINRLEAELKQRFPEIRWSFIEPDIAD